MTVSYEQQRKMHHELTNVGLRAQATAVGLVQLCIELRRANVLEDAAMERIKTAIADEVSLSAPRSISMSQYRCEIKTRLDRLFAGEQTIGSAESLAFGAPMDEPVK